MDPHRQVGFKFRVELPLPIDGTGTLAHSGIHGTQKTRKAHPGRLCLRTPVAGPGGGGGRVLFARAPLTIDVTLMAIRAARAGLWPSDEPDPT